MKNKIIIALPIICFCLVWLVLPTHAEANNSIETFDFYNVKGDTLSSFDFRVWDPDLKDSVYYYSRPRRKTDTLSQIRLILDNVRIINDTTLLINATIKNVCSHTVCFPKLYHTDYDIEAQILQICSMRDYQSPRLFAVVFDYDGMPVIRNVQHAGFSVSDISDIVILEPNESYLLQYVLKARNIKKFIESAQYLQVSIDYGDGISSRILLNNIVFDQIESNILKRY